MDIETALKEAMAHRQKVVDDINMLEAKKLELLQEALRTDGEIRLLNRLKENKDVPKGTTQTVPEAKA